MSTTTTVRAVPQWAYGDGGDEAYVELQHYEGTPAFRLSTAHARQLIDAVQHALDVIDGHCEG